MSKLRIQYTAQYAGPVGPTATRPIISSVRVEQGPGHDWVHVWNRGGKSGELCVTSGDGTTVAQRLLGNVPFTKTSEPMP